MPNEAAKSIPETVTELKQLAIDYAKQETVDPLKGLARFVGFGIAGALLLGFGVTMVLLALLRFLQTETSTALTGNWSWAPYLITFVAAAIVMLLAVRAMVKGKNR